MLGSDSRMSQLNRLLGVCISQYDDVMQQIRTGQSEIGRIRTMIDSIANDIREIHIHNNDNNNNNNNYARLHVDRPWFVPDGHSGGPSYDHSPGFGNRNVVVDPSLNVMNNYIYPMNLEGFFNRIDVAPTAEQIDSSITRTSYGDVTNPINELCPISLKPFEQTDPVSIINYCTHVFCRDQLDEWFRSNIRCPVCRHDIREVMPDLEPIYNNEYLENSY